MSGVRFDRVLLQAKVLLLHPIMASAAAAIQGRAVFGNGECRRRKTYCGNRQRQAHCGNEGNRTKF
jgi:hypothetical protein